jgi:hypothetical protein
MDFVVPKLANLGVSTLRIDLQSGGTGTESNNPTIGHPLPDSVIELALRKPSPPIALPKMLRHGPEPRVPNCIRETREL